MRRWVDVQLTNGEKTIFGKLLVGLNGKNIAVPNGCKCQKALLRIKRCTIHVNVQFSSQNNIDKVYIRNKCWNVKRKHLHEKNRFVQYLEMMKNYSDDSQGNGILYCIRRNDTRSSDYDSLFMEMLFDNIITELPETNSEQGQDKNSEQDKKRGRKGK